VPTVRGARQGFSALVAALDYALGRAMRPFANLLPRRLRRMAERIERQKTVPMGQIAAVGFLFAAIFYGLAAGGQIGRVGDSLLVFLGFGIENIEIVGHRETPELAILEKLEIAGSLVGFNVADAQERIAELPWVARATVRKFYPSTLSVEIEEREPFALWQRRGDVFVIDSVGTEIGELEESRHAALPFVVGERANLFAAEFIELLRREPEIAGRTRAAVLVAGRRWDLHLEDGIVVKLPEKDLAEALAQLVKLNAERRLLARDVIVVDLRLPDRITVRLPEGRSLEEVIEDGSAGANGQART
jgi:cell division protein FtsQ